jgi:hypothetical protein
MFGASLIGKRIFPEQPGVKTLQALPGFLVFSPSFPPNNRVGFVSA